jgi:hypothetical protein
MPVQAAWSTKNRLLPVEDRMAEASSPPSHDIEPASRTASHQTGADSSQQLSCNLHAEVTGTLDTVAFDLARLHVGVELAIAPDLMVKAPQGTLRAIIRSITTHAAEVAAGERMLIVALRRPAGIALVFTYEDRGQDQAMTDSALRPAQEQGALIGATLMIDVRPGIATTVTVMLRDPTA